MDVASLMHKTLDPIAEKEHLNSQIKEYEAVRKENQQIEEKITQLRQENHELMQHISKLKVTLTDKEYDNHNKLHTANFKLAQKANNGENSFNINRCIMGYTYVLESTNKEEIKIVTWYYNEENYVSIAITSSERKDLIKIVPDHPNFLNMRRFFSTNQDVKGLLASLYKYFTFMTQKERIT